MKFVWREVSACTVKSVLDGSPEHDNQLFRALLLQLPILLCCPKTWLKLMPNVLLGDDKLKMEMCVLKSNDEIPRWCQNGSIRVCRRTRKQSNFLLNCFQMNLTIRSYTYVQKCDVRYYNSIDHKNSSGLDTTFTWLGISLVHRFTILQ